MKLIDAPGLDLPAVDKVVAFVGPQSTEPVLDVALYEKQGNYKLDIH